MTNRFLYHTTFVALLALGLMLARQRQIAGDLTGVPLDDAYIHYRFADNLAHGRSFAFNPGEPTPGSTSPLWVVLLAGGELAGLDPIFTSKVLGALAFIACVWLTYRLALHLTDNDWLAALAGALVALSGRLAWAALSGMETTAFAALTLLAFYRLLNRPLDVITSALLGLAALLRPEGYLLFALIVINDQSQILVRGWSVISGQRSVASFYPSPFILRLLSNIFVFILLIAPYIVFSFVTTGSPLPNTFRANARELPALQYLFGYVVNYAAYDNVLAILFIFGAPIAWRDRRAWPAALWAIGFPLIAALLTPNLRHHGRYTIPLIPFNTLLGAIFVRKMLRDKLALVLHVATARFTMIAVTAIMLFSGGINAWKWSGIYAADVHDMTQMQVAMGRWIAQNTSSDATLALSDIGAITFLSGRRVIDIVGLVTPGILPAVAGKPVSLERDQVVFDYLARHRPDYVVIIPTWYPYLASSPGSRLIELHTVLLDHTPSVGGGDHLRAYRADWSWLNVRKPQNLVSANLGGIIALDGFDLTPGAQVQAGSPLTITLHWRSIQPTGRFKVFAHLIDASGKPIAQHDSEPISDLWPTDLWRPGDMIPDEHIVALPANLSPGTYTLQIGMYDAQTLARLPIASGGDAVVLEQVKVISGQ